MKIFKKIRFSAMFAWLAAFVLAFSWFAGVSIVSASAEDTMPTDITYIETDVENIAFAQHGTHIFLGFRLTESDYDDFGPFQGDFSKSEGNFTALPENAETHKIYEKYIALWLTYWKNFADMNSEGGQLDQLYAYWDGSSVGGQFANALTHRSDLKLLTYGFVISIPAGTTFPSATYVKGNCEGAPIMYRTTNNCAFYYDGSNFKPLDYAVAQGRVTAAAEMDAIDSKAYGEVEQAQLKSLIATTKAELKQCITLAAIQEKMDTFHANLKKIMSIEDYARLATAKAEKQESLKAFFDTLSEDNYVVEDWDKIVNMQKEGEAVINAVQSFEDVEEAFKAVKFAVNSVPTIEKNAAFNDYRAAAVQKVANAFDASLYRDAERAEGANLVQDGKQAVEGATSYAAVDGLSAEYIAKIHALKTDAQWQEEENAVVEEEENNQSSTESNNNVVIIPGGEDSTVEESGCAAVIISNGSVVEALAIAAAVGIILKKKKVGKQNEE